ncbi:MAG: Chaperone protein ClpB [bacterium ADurb.Bin374]|nr:MAG: Chaperone protein ClpB [bacterium ADurb.Bin374]
MRRKPYSVVLFDEIEKAHPDVFNVLLQLLDDGRLTDSQGRTVDFRNVVVIMTSNIGSQTLLDGISSTGQLAPDARKDVLAELRRSFRPEFLNRVDDIVLFTPLSKEQLGSIVELQIGDLRKRLAERRLTLDVTPAAKEWLIERGYDPVYGARPLKRLVQKEVETRLARRLIANAIPDGSALSLDVRADDPVIEVR